MPGQGWAAYKQYVEHVIDETLPHLRASKVFVSILPPDNIWDVAGQRTIMFCTELGMALMLGKKIIFVVQPGVPLPGKLHLVADALVEANPESKEGRVSLARRLVEEFERLQ